MTRTVRILAPAALLLTALLALTAGLVIGGAAAPREVLDPGAFVRLGLPVSKLLVNLSAAGLLGALVFAIWVLAKQREEYQRALDFAAASAAVLTVSSLATLLFTFVEIAGVSPLSGELFGATLAQFVSEIELGRLWLLVVIFAAITTVMAFAIRDQRALLLVITAAVIAVLPLAQQGHASGASGHNAAVTALTVHLLAVAVWLGGLMTLVVLHRSVDRTRLQVITSRYSTLALLAFIAVASSGIVSSSLRLASWNDLLSTGYGWIVSAKVISLTLLGVVGWTQRRRLIARISSPNGAGARVFWIIVVLELAVMGLASGLAAALGRTETPVPQTDVTEATRVTPAEWLTGDPLPAEVTGLSLFTEWKLDLAWTLIAVFGIFFYLAGVARLHRRGDRWPWLRTVLWVTGMLVLFYATNGVLNVYEQYLFSVHMLAHMVLSMVIPTLLVLGAPVTLALRTIEKRQDGSWGTREWIMWALHTPYAKFITHPLVAAVIFIGSLWLFYYSPLLRWSVTDHLGHQWMIVHFLFSGYLFVLTLVGIDPIPYRYPYPIRLMTLLATMASHAFFGISIMGSPNLFVSDWYGAMGRTWGLAPLADQSLGGGIAWAIGELPTLVLAIIVAIEWNRDDQRKAKRRDRDAERTGDRELREYNEMLERIAERDRTTAR